MKTVLVSELDGTLHNSEKNTTNFMLDVIYKFINQSGLLIE